MFEQPPHPKPDPDSSRKFYPPKSNPQKPVLQYEPLGGRRRVSIYNEGQEGSGCRSVAMFAFGAIAAVVLVVVEAMILAFGSTRGAKNSDQDFICLFGLTVIAGAVMLGFRNMRAFGGGVLFMCALIILILGKCAGMI